MPAAYYAYTNESNQFADRFFGAEFTRWPFFQFLSPASWRIASRRQSRPQPHRQDYCDSPCQNTPCENAHTINQFQ
jgi:hypothetical protein